MSDKLIEAQVQPVNRDAMTEPFKDPSRSYISPISSKPILPEYGYVQPTGLKYSRYTRGMPFGADPIEWQAQHQGAADMIAKGVGRLVTTTGTKFLTGLGLLYGIMPALASGDIDKLFDNAWGTYWGGLEEHIKELMPINHSRKYLEGNILNQMATLGFYMDDVVDGTAFMLSALIGSYGMGAAMKGANAYSLLAKGFSKATTAVKAGKAIGLAEKLPSLFKATNELDLFTMSFFNSATEATFEAKDSQNQILNQLNEKVLKGEMTYEEAQSIASKAARDTFVSNLFALMPSSYITNSMFFKSFKGLRSNLKGAMLAKKAGTLEDFAKIKRKDLFAIFGKEAGKNILSEGFYEENIQLAIQNLSKSIALGDVDSKDRFYNLAKNWLGNFFTDEGQKNIALGAIIGLIPGGVGGVRSYKADMADIARVVPLLDHGFTRFTDQNKTFFKRKPILSTESGQVIGYSKSEFELDEQGKPMPDYDKVANEFVRMIKNNTYLAGLFETANFDNDVLYGYIQNELFTDWTLSKEIKDASLIAEEGNRDFVNNEINLYVQQEFESLQKQGLATTMPEYLKEMGEEYKERFRRLSNVWENINEAVDLMDFGTVIKDVAKTKHLLKIAQYSEASRQLYLEDKRREIENKIEELENGSEANIPSVQDNIKILKKKLEQVAGAVNDSINRLKDLSNVKLQKGNAEKAEAKKKEDEAFFTKKIKEAADEAERRQKEKQESDLNKKPVSIEIGGSYKITKDNKVKNIKVTKLNEDGSYAAQELDEKGNLIGEVFPLSEDHIKTLQKVFPTDELPEEEGYVTPPESRMRGLMSIFDALTYAHYDEDEDNEIAFRDAELNRFLSNPDNKAEGLPVQFYIDFDSKYAKEFWDIVGDELRDKLKKGDLSLEEIRTLLQTKVNKAVDLTGFFKTQNLEYTTLLDLIPIRARIIVGDKPYDDGIFYHITDYNNIIVPDEIYKSGYKGKTGAAARLAYITDQKLRTRAGRKFLLENLFLGEDMTIKTSGKTFGYPHTRKGLRASIRKTFGIEEPQVKLGIGMPNGSIWFSDGEFRAGNYNPGSIYYVTKKTANGKPYHVKLAKSMLTEEHADILFDAILSMHSFTKSGLGGIHKMWDPNDDRVKDLNVGEVIDLLVHFGENTSLEYKDKNGKQPNFGKEDLKNKQLWVDKNDQGRLVLHYGMNKPIDLHDAENRVANKKLFIEWATANKPYGIRRKILSNNFFSLNDPLARTFKIGKLENKPNKKGNYNTYATLLIDTVIGQYEEEGVKKDLHILTTNLVPDEDGNLFIGPTVLLDMDKHLPTVVEEPVVKKPDTPKDIKRKEDEKVVKGVNDKDVNSIKPSSLKDLPIGTIVYGKKGNFVIATFKVVTDERGEKIFKVEGQVDPVLESKVDGKHISNTEARYAIIEYLTSMGENVKINIDLPIQVTDIIEEVTKEEGVEVETTLEDFEEISEEEIEELQKQVKKEKKSKKTRKKKETIVEEPVVKKEEKPIEPSQDDLKIGLPNGMYDRINPYHKGDKYEVWNKKQELKWLRSKLGHLRVRTLNGLINIARTGKTAFGQFKWDLITLSSIAEKGSTYHEAFHRVSLLYLTSAEREAIYKEARIKYKLGKDATERQIEEKLAEEFRSFIMSKENEKVEKKTLSKIISDFFKDLWDLITSLVKGQYRLTEVDIDHLFNSIEQGKYAWSRPIKENINRIKNTAYYKKTIKNVEFNSINTSDETRKVIRALTNVLVKFSASDFNSFKEARYDKLREWLNARPTLLRQAVADTIYKITKWDGVELTGDDLRKRQTSVANVYLNAANMYQELADNFEVVRELVDDKLLEYGFVPVNLRNTDEQTAEDHVLDNAFDQFDKQPYEKDSRDTVASSIKLMVASLNESKDVDPFTLTNVFVDFTKTWDIIMNDLHNSNSYEAMVSILEAKSKENYPYQELLTKLKNGSEDLRGQFFTSVRKYRHQFINSLYTYNSKDNVTNWLFSDADTDSAIDQTINIWSENLRYTNFVITNKEGGHTIDNKKLQEISNDFKTLKDQVLSEFKKHGELPNKQFYKEQLVEILSRVGVMIDIGSIDNKLSKDPETDESLVNFIANDISYLFGEQGILWSMSKKAFVLDKLYSGEQVVRKLAAEFVDFHPETISNSVLGAEGAIYYPYNQNSVATNIISLIREDDNFLESLSKSIFNTKLNGTTSSYFLSEISSKSEVRKNFGLYTFGGLFESYSGDRGRKFGNLSRVEDYLNKIHTTIGDKFRKGMFVFPSMADRTVYYVMKGIDTIKVRYAIQGENLILPPHIVDLILGYAESEKNRIAKVKGDLESGDVGLFVKNFHYYEDEKTGERDYDRANGLLYHHFPSFNEEGFDFEGKARASIIKTLETRIEEELKTAERHGIITKGSDGKYTNNYIDFTKLYEIAKDYGNNIDLAIRSIIAEYTINTIVGVIESEKMFSQDPAFYKPDQVANVFDDLVKRLGVLTSTADDLRESVPELGEDEMYNVATIRTQIFKSTFYDSIYGKQVEIEKNILSKIYTDLSAKDIKAMAERIVKNRLRPLERVNPSDAAVLISPEMYRQISIRLGEWPPEKRDAFELLQSGKKLTKEEEIKAYKAVMQPLKLVYYGVTFENGYAIPTYDKMALFTLFKPVVRGLSYDIKNIKKRLAPSEKGFEADTQLAKLLERMEDEDQPIHMFKFDSAVKVGGRDSFDYFDKSLRNVNDLTNIPVFQQSYRFLKRSQVTFPHDSATTKTGTQPIKVGLLDLNLMDKVYDLPGQTEKVTGKEVAQQVMSAVSALSRKGREKIFSMFGIDPEMPTKIDVKKLFEVLKKEARRGGKSDSIINALTIIETEYGDEKYLELDSLPADREWIYQKVLAIIGRHTIDLNLPGGQFIQSPSWGLRHVELKDADKYLDYTSWVNNATDELEVIHWENGQVKQMEIIISINLFKHVIPNYKNLTFDEQLKFIKENPEVIGYRIPTQGQNSMAAFKIVGFLPESVGDTIIIPNDFVTITGSDFDIDKVYIARYNYYSKGGKIIKVPFLTGTTEEENDKLYNNYVIDYFYNHLKYFEPALYKQLVDTKYDIYALHKEKASILGKEGELLTEYIKQYEAARERFSTSAPGSPEEEVAIADAQEYSKKIDDIQERYGLLKDVYSEEIAEKREEYNNFLENLQTILLEKNLITSKDEFRKWDIYDKNTKESVENKLIDAYMAVLKSEEHFPHTTSPLGELKGKLQHLAKEVKTWEGKEQYLKDLEYASPTKQGELKFEYLLGKKGIGPFALANTFHAFAQIYHLLYKDSINAPVLMEDGNVNFSAQRDVDNIYISRWFSALIDAHVDIAKDPYIIALNINAATYNVVNFLIGVGVGERSFLFLSQPILKEYAELYLSERGRVFGREFISPIGYLRDKYRDLAKDAKTDLSKVWDRESLEKDIQNFGKNTLSSEYYARQLEILTIFEQLNRAGTHLFEATQVAGVDTKSYGNNFGQIHSFLNLLHKVYRDDKFINFDKIVPYDPESMTVIDSTEGVSFLGEQLKNSVLLAREMFSGQTIMATKAFYDAHNIMLSKIGNLFSRDETTINLIDNKIYSYLVSKFFTDPQFGLGITPGKAEALLKGDEGIINTIYEIQRGTGFGEQFPELKSNLLIKDLQYIYKKDEEFRNFLSLPINRQDKFSKDAYTEAFLELFKHDSPKVKALARNLFIFSYLTSGFNPNLYSIYRNIPIEVLKEFENKEGEIVSFNDYIKYALNKMDSIEKNDLFLGMFDEIFENTWWNNTLVPEIKNQKVLVNQKYVNHGRNLIYTGIDDRRLYIGRNVDGERLYKPYVLITKGVERQIEPGKFAVKAEKLLLKFYGTYQNKDGKEIPLYVTRNKKSYRHAGIFISEMGFPSSIFKYNKQHYVLPTDKIQGTLEKAIPGFMYLDPETEQFVKDDLYSERGQYDLPDPKVTLNVGGEKIIGEIPELVGNITKVKKVGDPWEAQKRGEGISVIRGKSNHHYGNPWSHLDPSQSNYNIIKVNSISEAVDNYVNWIKGISNQDVEPERREWIANQISSGVLKGKILLYFNAKYTDRNHADALADLINEEPQRPISSFSKIESEYTEEAGELGFSKKQMLHLLGPAMYSKPLAQVAVKELLQNSFDAIKARQNITDNKDVGNIDIIVDHEERTITVKDDGIGMTPNIVKNAFLFIGGTNKEGLTESERSGGFGLAKVQFLLGSESVEIETTRDGITTIIKATALELYGDSFKILTKETGQKNGTKIIVKIPSKYTSPEGREREIGFFSKYSDWKDVDILTKPLIGNLKVTYTKLYKAGERKENNIVTYILPLGVNITEDILPSQLAKVKFNWGTANIYMDYTRPKESYPGHIILSSGIYQFNHRFVWKDGGKIIPWYIVIDIKPSVDVIADQYPFNNQREDFKPTVEEDILKLKTYLASVAYDVELRETVETFKEIGTMPKTDPSKDLTPMEREILFKGTNVEKIERVKKEVENKKIIEFEETEFSEEVVRLQKRMKEKHFDTSFSLEKDEYVKISNIGELTKDPFTPKFHNNTNKNFGNTEKESKFFADFGSVILDTVQHLGEIFSKRNSRYKVLTSSEEEKVFIGVSIDKQYHGIHLYTPFHAIFINPLAWEGDNIEGTVGKLLHTTIHEVVHTTEFDHDESFTVELSKAYGWFYEDASYPYYEGLLRSVFSKHFETYKQLRNEFNSKSTENKKPSLTTGKRSSTTAEDIFSNEETLRRRQLQEERDRERGKDNTRDKTGDVILSNFSSNIQQPLHKEKEYTELFTKLYTSVDEVEKALVQMPGFTKKKSSGRVKGGPQRVWVKSNIDWRTGELNGENNFGKAYMAIEKLNESNPGLVELKESEEASKLAKRKVLYVQINEKVLEENRNPSKETSEGKQLDLFDPILKKLGNKERADDLNKVKEFVRLVDNPNRSVVETLGIIRKDINDPILLELLNGLQRRIRTEKKIRISVEHYDETLADGYREELGSALMSVFHPVDTKFHQWGTIYMNADMMVDGSNSYDYIIRAFIHELVHLYTVTVLEDPTSPEEIEFANKVKKLYEIYKNKASLKGRIREPGQPSLGPSYGTINEFISDLLTDKAFIKEIAETKFNIFERIWNAILWLFGIDNSYNQRIRDYFVDFITNKAIFRTLENKDVTGLIPSYKRKQRERKKYVPEDISEFENVEEESDSTFEEQLKKSIEILEARRTRQIGNKYIKEGTQQEAAQFVAKLNKQLEEKKLIWVAYQFLRQAYRSVNKAWNDYQKQLEKEQKGEPNLLKNLPYLTRLKYVNDAYKIVEKYRDMFHEQFGFNKYKTIEQFFNQKIQKTIDRLGVLREAHESRGFEILIDKLTPYYHGADAIFKEKKEREYNVLPEAEKTKITLKEYQDKYVALEKDSLVAQNRAILRKELKKASRDVNLLWRFLDNMLDTRDPALAAMVKKFFFADEQSRIDSLKVADEIEEAMKELESFAPFGVGTDMRDYYDYMIEKIDGKYRQYRVTPWLSTFSEEWRQIYEDTLNLDQMSFLYIGGVRVNMTLRDKLRQQWKNVNAPMTKSDKIRFGKAKLAFIQTLVDDGVMTEDEATKYQLHEYNFRMYGDLKSLNEYLLDNNLVNSEALDEISDWVYHHAWDFRSPSHAGTSFRVNKETGTLEENNPGKFQDWSNPQWEQLLIMAGVPKDLPVNEQKELLRANATNDPRIKFYNLIDRLGDEADRELPFEFRLGSRLPGVEKELSEHIAEGDSIKEYFKRAIEREFTVRVDEEERGNKELTDDSGRKIYFLPIHFTSRVESDDQSYDIPTMYYKFWSMAHDYGIKQEILPEIELTKFFVNNRETIERDNRGKPKIKKLGEIVKGFLTKPKGQSNIAEMFNDWVLAVVYGKKVKEEGAIKIGNVTLDAAKMADFINKYTALNLLGINYVAGTANVILGESLEAIEAIVGQYTNVKSYNKANKVYLSNMPGFLGDIGAKRPSNVVSRLVEHFDILNEYGDINWRKNTRFRQLMNSNTLFFTSHAGEHFMQTRFLLSMLNDVIAYDKDGKEIGTMLDMYKMKDGRMIIDERVDLKKSKWTQDDQLEFSMRVKGILSRLHGEYSELGRVAIQRSGIGRMAYMFRKFGVPGFKRRWQRRQYNERLMEIVEGNYRTFGNFMGQFFRDLLSFQFHLASEDWSKLTRAEKANIHRTILEIGFLVATIILTQVALSLRGEADDEREARLWSFWAYQMMRFRAELLFFTPKLDEAMSILRSPMASMSVLENTIELISRMLDPIISGSFTFDRYDRGPWKGELKIKRTLIDMTPAYKQLYRMRDLGSQLNWFK
jgi:hypothetical protein